MSTDDQEKSAADSAKQLPDIDFTTFILSLSASALMNLGQNPGGPAATDHPPPANLPMAKQTIDLLALLEEKTRGNLNGEEERLLTHVLTDLRLKYANQAT